MFYFILFFTKCLSKTLYSMQNIIKFVLESFMILKKLSCKNMSFFYVMPNKLCNKSETNSIKATKQMEFRHWFDTKQRKAHYIVYFISEFRSYIKYFHLKSNFNVVNFKIFRLKLILKRIMKCFYSIKNSLFNLKLNVHLKIILQCIAYWLERHIYGCSYCKSHSELR